MRVSIILGTRPQIIKSAPVYNALRENGVDCDIVNTGQHYDYEMNRQFFSELSLPDPSADLNVGAGSPSEQVSAIVGGLGRLFAKGKPGLAVVPGDTNSALAAGVACSKSSVPVAHLEAGCRSNDFRMAEEVNRRVLDHMSQVLLCPTSNCVSNIRRERVLAGVVATVGDTMYDSVLKFMPSVERLDTASRLGLDEDGYAFMTLHRAETVDDPSALKSVLEGVGSLDIPVAFSVHPRTMERMRAHGISPGSKVKLMDPLPYLETLALIRRSKLVITDSGGVQKEAYWLGKPALIARETTEWSEIVKAGGAKLVGNSPAKVRSGFRWARNVGRRPFTRSARIFGEGHASSKVVEVVAKYLSDTGRGSS